MLGTMPFLGLHFIIWEIANVKILEFTAIQIYKVFPVTWLLVLLCVIIVAGSVIITFSLPYCITENRRIRLGIKLAAVRLKRHFGKSVAGVVLMQILVLAVTAAAYLMAVALIVGIIIIFMKPSFRISGVLTYGNGAKSMIGLCAGSAGIIFGLLAVGRDIFSAAGKTVFETDFTEKQREVPCVSPQVDGISRHVTPDRCGGRGNSVCESGARKCQ